jgi:hypothetical protein
MHLIGKKNEITLMKAVDGFSLYLTILLLQTGRL